jgi:hypothetical protein
MHKKYFDRGFRVLCILDESVEEIRKVFPEERGNLWVGVDSEQTTLPRYASEGALPLPRFYLVDDEGKVVSQDCPEASQIERLLERVFVPTLERDLAPALKDARAAYDRGRAGAAWKAAEGFAASEDAAVAEDAKFLREKVERYAAWQKDRIERLLQSGGVEEGLGELYLFEFRFPPMECAAWATKRATEVEKDPKVHADRFAWKKLRAALAKEAKATSKSALQSAASAYKTVVKDHAGTRAAAIAKDRLDSLQ